MNINVSKQSSFSSFTPVVLVLFYKTFCLPKALLLNHRFNSPEQENWICENNESYFSLKLILGDNWKTVFPQIYQIRYDRSHWDGGFFCFVFYCCSNVQLVMINSIITIKLLLSPNSTKILDKRSVRVNCSQTEDCCSTHNIFMSS